MNILNFYEVSEYENMKTDKSITFGVKLLHHYEYSIKHVKWTKSSGIVLTIKSSKTRNNTIERMYERALIYEKGYKTEKHAQKKFTESIINLLYFVGNKAKGRIPKRVFQENKARQIFPKTIISYPLIRTLTCAYQGVRNNRFSENLACFVFLKRLFWWLVLFFMIRMQRLMNIFLASYEHRKP